MRLKWPVGGHASASSKGNLQAQSRSGLKSRVNPFLNPEPSMPKKIRVEADICAPKPVPPKGYTITTGHGQKISLERGSHTRSKKNPGKRPSKGG
jgi:hypothetical protein